MTDDIYSFSYGYKMRAAELQDIAAMDRLAAELAPPSALRRWARQRQAGQASAAVRRGGLRRLLGTSRTANPTEPARLTR